MIHRKGTDCECDLPERYDEKRTRIAKFKGVIVVAHPDFEPCYIEDGKLVPIQPYLGPSI